MFFTHTVLKVFDVTWTCSKWQDQERNEILRLKFYVLLIAHLDTSVY